MSVVTVCVMPVRGQPDLTDAALRRLQDERLAGILIVNNGQDPETRDLLHRWRKRDGRVVVINLPDANIHQCWNHAWDWCATGCGGRPLNIWFVNNDAAHAHGTAETLARCLRNLPDAALVYPDYRRRVADGPDMLAAHTIGATKTRGTYRHGGMSGWSFMVRGELPHRFDEQFEWWYGDDDFAFAVDAAGGHQYRIDGIPVDHLSEATAQHETWVPAAKRRDAARFAAKWPGR